MPSTCVDGEEFLEIGRLIDNSQHVRNAKRVVHHETELLELEGRNEELFARRQFDLGRLNLEHSIELTSDQPVVKKQYKVPVQETASREDEG